MFWSMRYAQTSSIDGILERESGFTLEDLLGEDDLLQECKSHNTKLLEFLCQPETISKLIVYITEMPTDDDTEDRRFKYPYVASEVLSCDLQAIRDVLLGESREKMAELFALLQQPPPINPVLAGYFGKVLMALQKADADAFQAYFAAAWAAAAAPEEAAAAAASEAGEEGEEAAAAAAAAATAAAAVAGRAAEADASAAAAHWVGRGAADCDHAGVGEPAAAEPGQITQFIARDMSTSWLPQAVVPALVAALGGAEGDAASNISQLLVSLVHAGKGVPTAFAEEEARRVRIGRRELPRPRWRDALPHPVEVALALLNAAKRARASPAPRSAPMLIDAFAEHVDAFFAALAAPAALPRRRRLARRRRARRAPPPARRPALPVRFRPPSPPRPSPPLPRRARPLPLLPPFPSPIPGSSSSSTTRSVRSTRRWCRRWASSATSTSYSTSCCCPTPTTPSTSSAPPASTASSPPPPTSRSRCARRCWATPSCLPASSLSSPSLMLRASPPTAARRRRARMASRCPAPRCCRRRGGEAVRPYLESPAWEAFVAPGGGGRRGSRRRTASSAGGAAAGHG